MVTSAWQGTALNSAWQRSDVAHWSKQHQDTSDGRFIIRNSCNTIRFLTTWFLLHNTPGLVPKAPDKCLETPVASLTLEDSVTASLLSSDFILYIQILHLPNHIYNNSNSLYLLSVQARNFTYVITFKLVTTPLLGVAVYIFKMLCSFLYFSICPSA